MAAMATFPYEQYVSFLGLRRGSNRIQQLKSLPSNIGELWLNYEKMIEDGILYAGRWERYYQSIGRFAGLIRGNPIRTLFEFDDLDKQQVFVHEVWDRTWWKCLFVMFCSPFLSRILFKDPAFYAYVSSEISVGRYIFENMVRILNKYLARKNFMLSLIFRGQLPDEDLPPYLVLDSVNTICQHLNRIQVHTANLLDFLEEAPAKSFTKFSLSDVPSFLNPAEFERMLNGIIHAAAPGARFCIRQFLTDHYLPPRFTSLLHRETNLEEELHLEDRAFVYRFIVGTVE
jgi:S-adenosylmethionine-diacylglycerol 3-amino-3-carboxypropyl transferase